jgi:hypothetical protein
MLVHRKSGQEKVSALCLVKQHAQKRRPGNTLSYKVFNDVKVGTCRFYEGESIIRRNAVAFVFVLAALSFSRASLGVVPFLSQLGRFEVARSVSLSQPYR